MTREREWLGVVVVRRNKGGRGEKERETERVRKMTGAEFSAPSL